MTKQSGSSSKHGARVCRFRMFSHRFARTGPEPYAGQDKTMPAVIETIDLRRRFGDWMPSMA